ncbi:MAG: selenide, water dikinase SelD [Pseudomonadota bacterium]
MTPLPLTRDLVLIGGGHAHALVLRRWGMRPLPGARLTLINPGPTAPYTGMLPGFIAGHYARDELEIDLVRLARFAGARLILGEAEGIDRKNQRIQVSGRGDIGYDVASIDIGITSDMPDLPGFLDNGIPAKPLGILAHRWAAFRDNTGPAEIVVIGGGVGGVELALAMQFAMADRDRPVQVTIIDSGTALPGLGPRARKALLFQLAFKGITLMEHTAVRSVEADAVTLATGQRIPSHFTVGAAGARPYRWLATTGLDLTDGYLDTDASLRTSDPAIYSAGDCAHLTHAPRPKAGVFAVRAAPVLAHNLRADLAGGARRRFEPQGDYLKLISLGHKAALGEKWGLVALSQWVWAQKDRIDRRFMDKLADLPRMPAPTVPREAAHGVRAALGDTPLCGGCGAKVGGDALARVLADLPGPGRADVDSMPGDDAAVLRVGGATQVVTTDHLRAFTDDPQLMARIAAVHAMGDIWAMGARAQSALATVILPPLSPRLQERWLAEIMDGAIRAFGPEGAAIVGGHTTMGAELTVGFTVTGLLEGAPITLAGARPGDRLILTRPIGSGTVLAGEMAGAARGADVAAVLAEMARSQGTVAEALASAHAMTDVTGFGLAGHLMGMCAASGVAAQVSLDAMPVYQGAGALAAQGVRSSLYEANLGVAARMTTPQTDRAALLFDPQTSGGLLAAVSPEDADAVLAREDFPAWDIGEITEGAPFIAVR